jgi:glycosyltransferase involved in cell wall biosynthesis
MLPKITIITVVYNAVSTLEESVLSVINQNFDDFEYIIID